MMNIKMLTLACLLTGIVVAAPKPSLAPEPEIWTLDVSFTQPMQYVTKDAKGNSSRYWYTVLTLVNNSGQDVPFYPKFELMTDTWQTIPSDTGITKPVYNTLKRMNEGSFPFLVTLDEVEDTILQGGDNAVDLIVVWEDFDPKAKEVKMFFAGLSNETAVVEVDKDGKKHSYHLQKTLELSYSIPGDEVKRNRQSLVFEDNRWIMR